jgi:glycosyltransferase involved in cell wall biosynthesis
MSDTPDGASGLRVLMTADAVGGVWQYALDLADGLRPHGVETILAVLGPVPSADQQHRAEASGVKLVQTGLQLDWMADRQDEVEEAGYAIARLAAEIRPDVVHLNAPALAANAAFPCPVVSVCHSCVATWWQAVRSGPLPDTFLWRTELVRRGYRAADMLLAPTMSFAEATSRRYDLQRTPTVVRNGRRAVKADPVLSANPFAFTAGRLWDEGKNLASINRAAAHLSIPVLAAGPLEGPNNARVEASHVAALGRLRDADVARYLNARPIYVSAALYEPFGLAVLEAAQAGCALVLSDIPTFRELWDGAAIFVSPQDDRAMAAAIERLAQDSDERMRMGEAARKVADSYSVEAMSEGVLAAYRAVLAAGTHTPSFAGAAA